jgi:hypothetical protein
MPVFAAQTTTVDNGGIPIWQSPDGQRKMWKITMTTPQGQQAAGLKTYSQAIAQIGWNGQVETYEKQGNQGIETFVKQPQQAGYGSQPVQQPAGQAQGGQRQYSAPRPQQAPTSPYTMYLSYAKDIAVAMIVAGREFNSADLLVELRKVANGGEFLYETRVDNPNRDQAMQEPDKAPAATEPDTNELNGIFGQTEPLADDGSAPWPTSPQA